MHTLRKLSPLLLLALLPLPAFAQADAGSAASPAQAGEAAPLRALPAWPKQMQFDGERAARTLDVFLSPSEARGGGELVLSLQSGVSVMPEASTLSVTVNGRAAATLPLGGSRPPAAVALAPNLLKPGWNAVTFLASQRHRVDCSLEATYDLWTRIDPEHSGLRFTGGTGHPLAQPADMPLLSRGIDGTLPVRIRLAGQSNSELAASFTLAALAARGAGGSAVRVDARSEALGGAGLEILAGSTAHLTRLGIPAAMLAAAESGPQWIAPATGQSARLIALINSPADIERAAAELAEKAPAPASQHAPLEDQTVRFSDLGVGTEEFSGRLFHEELELRLPSDSLSADYGRVSLLLQAAYAAGLDRGAGLSVFVNDRLAATLPFGRDAGEEFKRREIEMPLSAFQPGVNRIALEARLPDAQDRACDPATQISGSPRFLLLGESELSVPRLAHMARLPELASTVRGDPALGRLDPVLRMALADDDPDTVSAAAAFFVRNALGASTVPPLELGPIDRTETRGEVVIGAARAIGSDLLGAGGLDAPAFLAATERETGADLARNGKLDALSTGSIPGSPQAGEDGQSDTSRSALQSWRMRTKEKQSEGFPGLGTVDEFLSGARTALGFSAARETPPLDGVKLALSQSMPAGRDGPLTVLTAFTAEDLAAGMDMLVRPENWDRLAGQTLLLDADGKLTTLPAQSVRFVPTQPTWSPGNMRLVTAAWFSLNPPAYALIVLVCALLFGAVTHLLVRRVGVRAA